MIDRRWEHAGMVCALRHGVFDVPCGYVLVPDGHPLHGASYEEADALLDVHGGVTYAGDLEGIGYAIGFDMAHAGDLAFEFGAAYALPLRTDEECVSETEWLAEQLAALAERGK